MSRATLVLIILVLVLVGVMVVLSTAAREVPTHTIEQDVTASANAG